MTVTEAWLVLADGTTFRGEKIGADPVDGVATGEVVFNTVMSGYQEVITDPSYAGQIISFTYPHIGNYGTTPLDDESRRPYCRGIVVRELARRRSSWRSEGDLDHYLRVNGIPGIAGIDTRRLTRHIRDAGSIPAAFGTADVATLRAAAAAERGTDGMDLVAEVTCEMPYTVPFSGVGPAPRHVVAIDLGVKMSMLRQVARIASVDVVPASTSAEDILARSPDGVFLSNGPGDPAAVSYVPPVITGLLGKVPIFGICLGHQLLCTALGASTYKMPFGHHGGNHPVRRLETGTIEITSHNHNYAVSAESLQGLADVSHIDLNDGVVEGVRCDDRAAFSVQYHPEAGPGPSDASYLFTLFEELMIQGV